MKGKKHTPEQVITKLAEADQSPFVELHRGHPPRWGKPQRRPEHLEQAHFVRRSPLRRLAHNPDTPCA